MVKQLNWRLAGWWAAANAVGALISMVAVEIEYASHVPRDLKPRPEGYNSIFLVQLLVLILMGLLQVITCCSLIALNGSRKKRLQVAAAILCGILTALLIPMLGTFVMYVKSLLAVFTLLPCGIVFGSMLGLSRWRALTSA